VTVRETSKRTAVVPESFFNALGARLSKDLGSHAAQNVLYELGRDAGHSFIAVAEDRLGRRIKTALRRGVRLGPHEPEID